MAWEVKGILCHSEEEAQVYVGEPEPLYSQEYVSALDKVAQFWIGESAGWKKRAEDAEKRITELSHWLEHNIERAKAAEQKLATPVRLSGTTHPRCRQQHADDIRAAGFKCVGDE